MFGSGSTTVITARNLPGSAELRKAEVRLKRALSQKSAKIGNFGGHNSDRSV